MTRSTRCNLAEAAIYSPEEVIRSGKAHGATREDLYGCLYFHVSDQLHEFADRVARFNISFKMFNKDALDFAKAIRHGELSLCGVPSSIRFDRIDVSNVIDYNYLGISPVLEAWAEFLKHTDDATIVGHLMNWPKVQPGAEGSTDPDKMEEILGRVIKNERVGLCNMISVRCIPWKISLLLQVTKPTPEQRKDQGTMEGTVSKLRHECS